MVRVPDRLQESVCEAEVEQVLDGLLAQVVVDAEDLLLGEDRVKRRVQLPRAGQVLPERLLDDDARAGCAAAPPARKASAGSPCNGADSWPFRARPVSGGTYQDRHPSRR